MKTDKLTKMAKVTCPNDWSCEKCGANKERCIHRTNAEKLIEAGYDEIAQTVDEFAEEVKGAFFINNYTDIRRVNRIVDETAREYYEGRKRK